ncbi:hypothetical protein JQ580_00180 [Bradyrhizobium japonicum]|uniref:ORC-CDC6 family AAA ATPase n=1 Tax=Bradyrhizobium japonicum TaxID=375 RepID=UPI001BAA1D79|nr:hypothetical protein [Bradyrhizobium japonicum]MBR0989132.1 hypothetical protein [Bradyrhizobium japonicum]
MGLTDKVDVVSLQKAFINFSLRAEKYTDDMVVDTFVDSAPMMDLLSNANSQVVYGRRGTGKTHALKFVADLVAKRGEIPVYMDLRSIGSNTSIYNDTSKSLAERSTQLINDVLQAVLASLYPCAVAALDTARHPEQVAVRLDDFQTAISSVKIRRTIERETTTSSENTAKAGGSLAATLAAAASVTASASAEATSKSAEQSRAKTVGEPALHIDFGSVQAALTGLIEVLGAERVWLFIDEWSEVPLELQPYLADLLRRTVLPSPRCIVKIAAIEHRSNFTLRGTGRGEYTGVELGADMSASLNLDDFLVFDADEQRSIQFFKNLIFRHYSKSENVDPAVRTAEDLIHALFTQVNVFEEFVRAVEGVPRDALNLAATVATKAFNNKISMNHVREAARDWYQRDKASVIRGSDHLSDILMVVINEVIGRRRARAFLFPNNVRDETIEDLFDARLLHILKKNVSAKDQAGKRFDVFKIDYGCYVDLINTGKEPKMLFEADDELIEVPRDDYRSIRRAILTPEQLREIAANR